MGTPRNPIDKYTKGPMPKVHVSDPTAALNHIDLDLLTEWEQVSGEKLLALPFGMEVWELDRHDSIKNQLLSAVAEITQGTSTEVSSPIPSKDALRDEHTPTSFLIYNLSKDQANTLLEREVWSSMAITFRITPLFTSCPDFLFSITGFSTQVMQTVTTIVQNVWNDPAVRNSISDILLTIPFDERAETQQDILNFLAALNVHYLDMKDTGGTLKPVFNVYSKGNLIKNDNTWTLLHDTLATCDYRSSMQRSGKTHINLHHCGICHSVDHLRGLCTFPDIKGWNGPRKCPEEDRKAVRPGNFQDRPKRK